MRTTTQAMTLVGRKLLTGLSVLGLWLATSSAVQAIDAGDDFTGSVDPNKWGTDFVFSGKGQLTQANGELEFTIAKGSKADLTYRPWVLTQFPMTNDWEVQAVLINTVPLPKTKQYASMGLEIQNWSNRYDFLYSELYATSFDTPPSRGIYSAVYTDDALQGADDSFNHFGILPVNPGAVRVTFTAATKILTIYYDTNSVDGLQWILSGAINVTGTGSGDLVTDWQMTDSDRFSVLLYGYDEKTVCTSGALAADDFTSTGGSLIPPTRLTAAFDGVSESCKSGAAVSCKLKGKLIMTNGTASPVDDTRVRVFLSSNNTFEEGEDTLIGTSQTRPLKIGKAKKLKVSATLNDAGSFVLAVADNGAVLTSFQLPGGP